MKQLKSQFLFLVLCLGLASGMTAVKKLTYDQAVSKNGGGILSPLPAIDGWLNDGGYLEFREGKLYIVDAVTGKSTPALDKAPFPVLDDFGLTAEDASDRTADLSRLAFVHTGNIYVCDTGTGKVETIDFPEGEKNNPVFSPDGGHLAFTAAGNFYVHNLRSGETWAATADGSATILNGYASWVYYEEILGRSGRYRAFWWAPDGRRLVFMRFDQGDVPVFTLVSSAGDYGDVERQYYPKPGYPNPEVTLGVLDLTDRRVSWIPRVDDGGNYLAFPLWGPEGDYLIFQWMNRGQDQIMIYRYGLDEQKPRPVYKERQKYWVEFFEEGSIHLCRNGELLLRSSRDGWYHIYRVDGCGKVIPLTGGAWSVTDIDYVDEAGRQIFFTASKQDTTETGFHSVRFDGRDWHDLTRERGSHRIEASPSGKLFIDTYSALDDPPQIRVIDGKGDILRKVADSSTGAFRSLERAKIERFFIHTDDGFKLPVLWYLPPNLDRQSKQYPLIVRIYGGPGAAVVRNAFPRRLSDYYLAQQGIIVMYMDHRGAGHHGKTGMDLMHRSLGKWEMNDLIQVVAQMRKLPFIDADRVGISGGSYGGYVSAMALTHAAEYFRFGIANFPVIDWRLYDSVYTERYMDTPEENPEGYKEASVLTYMNRYRGGLRLTHGSLDDNVHMQNTMQFLSAALSADKTVELMIYPGERHGFRSSMREEYNRSSLNFWLKNFFGKNLE